MTLSSVTFDWSSPNCQWPGISISGARARRLEMVNHGRTKAEKQLSLT